MDTNHPRLEKCQKRWIFLKRNWKRNLNIGKCQNWSSYVLLLGPAEWKKPARLPLGSYLEVTVFGIVIDWVTQRQKILEKWIAFRARIIRFALCIILYYMHYDSFQMQDGAILALCILTLVTAVILLVDFIIMARCLFTSMWSFRIKHLSFSRSVRNRRWKAPSVV